MKHIGMFVITDSQLADFWVLKLTLHLQLLTTLCQLAPVYLFFYEAPTHSVHEKFGLGMRLYSHLTITTYTWYMSYILHLAKVT